MKKMKCSSIAISGALFLAILASCSKDNFQNSSLPDVAENGANPDESVFANAKMLMPGYVYTMSNAASGNAILIYHENSDGTLEYDSEVASGGNGLGDGLGSQGSLALNDSHTWLFAVNAGSNSISSFAVASHGGLTLASTVSSNGIRPVSVCVHENMLYVVNDSTSDISGFMVGGDGSMTLIPGSYRHLSADYTDPAQISFNAMGDHVYVTEKATSKIAVFATDTTMTEGTFVNSTGVEPFGFAISRNAYLVVTNAYNGLPYKSSVTGYDGVSGGWLMPVAEVEDHQTAACWIALTKHTTFGFVTNTGSNSISSYYIGRNGEPVILSVVAANTGEAPIDITVDGNNYYVYNINSEDHTISCFERKPLGGLEALATVSGLPEYAAGIAAY